MATRMAASDMREVAPGPGAATREREREREPARPHGPMRGRVQERSPHPASGPDSGWLAKGHGTYLRNHSLLLRLVSIKSVPDMIDLRGPTNNNDPVCNV